MKTLQEQDSQKDSLYDVPEKTADVITLREQDSREQVPEEVGIIPSESKSKHLAIKLPESNKSPFPPTPISASIPIGAIIEMYKSDNNLLTQPRKQSLPKIVPFARFTGYIAPKNKTLSAITSLTDSYTGIIHKRTKTSLLRVVKLERRMIVLANCTLYVFKDLDSKSIYNEHVRITENSFIRVSEDGTFLLEFFVLNPEYSTTEYKMMIQCDDKSRVMFWLNAFRSVINDCKNGRVPVSIGDESKFWRRGSQEDS